MPRFPQVQENVPVATKELPPSLLAEVERMNRELAEQGRILVRPSGTEPVVRVLAEAEDYAEARSLCGTITDLVRRELG
jgi:phosphoglucosamine mutase